MGEALEHYFTVCFHSLYRLMSVFPKKMFKQPLHAFRLLCKAYCKGRGVYFSVICTRGVYFPLIVLSTLHVLKTAPQSPQFSSRSIYYLSYQGCLLTSIYCAAHSFTVFPPQCQRIGYTEPGISVHIRKSNSVLDGTQIESVDLVFFGFALGSQPFQNGLTIDAV